MTATIVAADVVAVRGDSAIDVSRCVRVQDCVSNFDCFAADPTADRSRVAGNRAVHNRYRVGAYSATVAIVGIGCGVTADCAVSNLHPSGAGDASASSRRVAADSTVYDTQAPIVNRDAATPTGRRVTADCAVDNCDTPGALNVPLLIPPPSSASPVELPLNVLLKIVKKK